MRAWSGPSPRVIRSLCTQFPNVPAPTPSSRATSAIGLPVSRTIVTAPSRNSASYFLRSDIASPHRRCLHGNGGCPAVERGEVVGVDDGDDELVRVSRHRLVEHLVGFWV